MNLFKKRKKDINDYKKNDESEKFKPEVPNGLYTKCNGCGKTIYTKEIDKYKICLECGYNFRLTAKQRLKLIADQNTFEQFDENMKAKNPLDYPDYEEKLKVIQDKTNMNDAVLTGKCQVYGKNCVICIMDSNFIMGSMGSVVGEKITRAFEFATKNRLPIVIFTASGGARMQEGILSLMQMAKVSAACAKHSDEGLLYVSVLTDPTTGGVTASFAMLGDIILAEPKTLIGFAGPRVIQQTIKQSLPENFQTAEFLLEHGFIDKIVERKDIKQTLSNILKIHL